MIELIGDVERPILWLVWAALGVSVVMMLSIVVQRMALAFHDAWQQRLQRRYDGTATRAMHGDRDAIDALARMPARHRISVARFLMLPLIADRDPARIAATRTAVEAMAIVPIADRYLRSRWWWRRALALRAVGLAGMTDHTAAVVAALDDPHADVRGAALDALADLRDPRALPALVVRMHDSTLHRGRRAAALTAYGGAAESFLLDLAQVDVLHRLNYAQALGVCGTARSRPTLCDWALDARGDVRAAVFNALTRIGLDDGAAALAVDALADRDPAVRAMAAGALRGSSHPAAVAALSARLNDAWPVAVNAARSLRSTAGGRAALEARTTQPDSAGELARQMLWEVAAGA